jgi:hypothetical protein
MVLHGTPDTNTAQSTPTTARTWLLPLLQGVHLPWTLAAAAPNTSTAMLLYTAMYKIRTLLQPLSGLQLTVLMMWPHSSSDKKFLM